MILLYHPKVKPSIIKYLNAKLTSSFDEFINYEGTKFYLITIFEIWDCDINKYKNKIDDVNWNEIFTDTHLAQLKSHKYPLIFDSSGECVDKKTFDTFTQFCLHINIEKSNVYISLPNAQSVDLNLKAYPNLKDYNFFSVERFVYDAVEFKTALGDNVYKFKFNENKRFLFTNRRYSLDRAYLYFKLHQQGLLENIHCTFRLDPIYSDDIITLNEVITGIKMIYNDLELIDYIERNVDELNKSLPHDIKSELSALYKSDYKKIFLYSFWNLAAHNSTDINIISETYRVDDKINPSDIHHKTMYFITEKTYRTMMMKQPFIMFSNPYALKYLREAGYKTFSPFINESYDEVENIAERQNLIINEIKRLNELSNEDFGKIMDECQKIANYNYDILMTRAVDKYHNTICNTGVMRSFFKEIDNSLTSTVIRWYNKY